MFMLIACNQTKPNYNEIKPHCNKGIANDKGICRIATNPRTKPTPIKISKRVALVIGNADYKFAPLKNPVNDAKGMTEVLKDLGFYVIYEKNANRELMIAAINKFQKKLGKDVLGLFYFSGHGIQHEGINYMIPIDMSELTVSNVKFNSVKIDYVLSTMTETNNQVNIIILDACRDNPFQKGYKTMATKGLAIVNYAPSGSLIAYATAPNQVAKDGYGDNSPYTKHLKTIIRKPGLSIEKMFKEVRNAVLKETNDQQTPWEHSSLKGDDIYLAGKEQPPLVEPEPEPQLEPEPPIEPEPKPCQNCDCQEIRRKELRGFDPLRDEEKEFKKTCEL